MDLDNEELEKTKSVKQAYNTIYTEMCRYMELYNQLLDTIEQNYYSKDKILKALGIEYRDQDLSEDRICSLIESLLKEKRRVEEENEELKKQIQFRVDYCNKLEEELFKPKVDLDKYEITIPLENTGLEDIEYYYKKGDKWYAHYKETQVDKTKVKELEEQAKSKVTEKELKEMIIGMLE